MGDIAATAAGNADFGEELRATFQQHDFGIGSASAQVMAAKKPAAPPPTTMTRRELIRANLTGCRAKVSPKRETFCNNWHGFKILPCSGAP